MSMAYRVAVDLSNPGEFFACCGLLELSSMLGGYTTGSFTGDAFELRGPMTPLNLLGEMAACKAEELPDLGEVPIIPRMAPLRLTFSAGTALILDAWVALKPKDHKVVAAANRPWKLWAGQQRPLGIWQDLQLALKGQLNQFGSDPEQILRIRVPLSGRFGFDPGAAWNALDMGFSPNEQQIPVASSPAVEMLAAIGIQRFRTTTVENPDDFTYCTWEAPLPASLGAAAVVGALDGIPGRRYRTQVVSRGSYTALSYSTLQPWRQE